MFGELLNPDIHRRWSEGMDEVSKQDARQAVRDYYDMNYYFAEKGRALRAKKEKSMSKKAFWNGFEKRAKKEEGKEISHTLKRTLQGAGIGAGAMTLASIPRMRHFLRNMSLGARMGIAPGALVGIGESIEKKKK